MSGRAGDSDRELAAIAAGDGGAFARWLAAAEEPLRRSLRSFATVVDTEAVLQEALLRVWQVAPRCVPDGQPDGLLRMASRITRNLAVSAARRHRLLPLDDAGRGDGDDALLPVIEPGSVPDPAVRAAIFACLAKLPGQPRAAIDARIAADGGEDDHTLAARLAMRLNTFLQNVTRARRLLAECLRRAGIDLDRELA